MKKINVQIGSCLSLHSQDHPSLGSILVARVFREPEKGSPFEILKDAQDRPVAISVNLTKETACRLALEILGAFGWLPNVTANGTMALYRTAPKRKSRSKGKSKK